MIIWLVSYPRSGNTLTRAIFKHYFDLGSFSVHGDKLDIGANPELGDLVGHLEGDRSSIDLDELRGKDEIFAIKTHEIPNATMATDDMYLHILRDGRDSSLSYYHYLRNVAGLPETTLTDVISGRVTFGSWGRHTLKWHQANLDNLLRVRFEDITPDIDGFADRLGELLGRKRNTDPFPGIDKFRSAAPGFIRSGRSGGWREEFTELQRHIFDHYNGMAMRLAGYADPAPTATELDAYSLFCRETDGDLSRINALQGELATAHARIEQLERRLDRRRRRVEKVKSFFGLRSKRRQRSPELSGVGAQG